MDKARLIDRFPSGVIQMPPSKSVAHRAMICAALAEGESRIKNLAFSEDIEATRRCVGALGAAVAADGQGLRIRGAARGRAEVMDCGESGTTLRLLIPIASVFCDSAVFTGRGRLMQRPLDPYREALAEHGVRFCLTGDTLTLCGRLRPGVFRLPGDVSSQFISGLLLALPLLEQDSEIRLTTPLQSAAYVALTIDMMQRFGVTVSKNGCDGFTVRGAQRYAAADVTVEADYSQAAFFLVAGALGAPCECRGLSPASKQGDKKIIDILQQCGARIELTTEGGLIASPGELTALTVDVSEIPDLVPPLAALFAFCEGKSRLVNAGRLRHKESDRLQTVASALGALGADVVVEDDALVITGAPSARGGRVPSFGDHRIAMMGAVAAIRCDGAVWIEQSGCVAKSYPDFWQAFGKGAVNHGQYMG